MYQKFFIKQLKLEVEAVKQIYVQKITKNFLKIFMNHIVTMG